MVFDLDPGAPADIVQCCQVGLWLRDLLAKMKLNRWAKTIWLERTAGLRAAEYVGDLRPNQGFVALSRPISRARACETLVTSNMSKAVRNGKVFVDWSQNDEHKTTICVYSLRAREEPTVSTPVTWNEVENCLKKKKPSS